jgi:hypothetical protein
MNEKIKWFNAGFSLGLIVPLILAVLWHKRDQGKIDESENLIRELREVQSSLNQRYRELESGNIRLRELVEDARGYTERISDRLTAGAEDYREAIGIVESVLEDLEGLESVLAGGASGGGAPGGYSGIPP